MSKVYGIIGKGIEIEWIKAMHQAAFELEKIEAKTEVFEIEEKDPEALANFCYESELKHIFGLSVSNPFQEKIMDLLDYYDPIAKELGFVDTIKSEDSNLNGYNGKATGILQALQEKTTLPNKKALILGMDKEAEATAYGLKEFAVDVFIWDKNQKKAEKFAENLDIKFINYRAIQAAEFDIIINTVKLNAQESLLSTDQIKKGSVVLEINLPPNETKLIEKAKKAGAQTITGKRVLLHETAGQFEIWFNKTAPIKAMEKALNS